MAVQKDRLSEPSDGLNFAVPDIRHELPRMKKGRMAASDGVTVGMPSQLSDHHLCTLADAFSIRSASPVETGGSAPTVPGWHKLASYLIPKRHPVRLRI